MRVNAEGELITGLAGRVCRIFISAADIDYRKLVVRDLAVAVLIKLGKVDLLCRFPERGASGCGVFL